MSEPEINYIRQWLDKAEEDLLVARQLLSMDVIAKGAVGFHLQQAAEKFLKAFLFSRSFDPPKTHNIEYLIEQCKTSEPDFSKVVTGNLTDYGVEVRYPGDFLEPSLNELQILIIVVEEIRDISLRNIHLSD
ncbi:MAG: HEPN domain-containing protein [Bacteroidota bacterium]